MGTIDFYNQNAAAFVERTASADMSPILGEFVGVVKAGGCVLDWGCGSGRDSRFLIDKGFSVVSTDACAALCEQASALFGIEVRCEAFEDLAERDAFDGIWANASLLHVPKRNLPLAFDVAWQALKNQGVLYASFKYGDFEGERDGRWFTDLDEDALEKLLESSFQINHMWVTHDVRPECQEQRWLNCLAIKRS